LDNNEGWNARIDLKSMNGWIEREYQCDGCGEQVVLSAYFDVTDAYVKRWGRYFTRIGPDYMDKLGSGPESSESMNRKPVRKPSQNATKSKKAGKPSASTAKGKAVKRPARAGKTESKGGRR